jgi:restriction endonuclease S subunit
LTDLKYITLPETTEEALRLEDGDILINRTNSKELVGKCAVFHEKRNYIFASYLIRMRVKSDLAEPDFLEFTINSPVGRQQIDALSRQIIGQANINSQELRSLKIPLPPLDIQHQLVDEIAEKRAEIACLKEEAKKTRGEATKAVEEMILGIRPVNK